MWWATAATMDRGEEASEVRFFYPPGSFLFTIGIGTFE